MKFSYMERAYSKLHFPAVIYRLFSGKSLQYVAANHNSYCVKQNSNSKLYTAITGTKRNVFSFGPAEVKCYKTWKNSQLVASYNKNIISLFA